MLRALPGEQTDDLRLFEEDMLAAIKPADALEACHAGDVIIEEWEVRRLRALRQAALSDGYRRGMHTVLQDHFPGHRIKAAVEEIYGGNKECLEMLKEATSARGMNQTDVMGVGVDMGRLARLDALINSAIRRRDSALRELERRRFALAQRLKDAIADDAPAAAQAAEVERQQRMRHLPRAAE